MSVFGFFMTLFGCTQNDDKTFRSVSVDEFAKVIADTSVVRLDVRTDTEFNEGHIDGVVHIDVLKESFLDNAKAKLPMDRTIALYCMTGRRSKTAARMLAKEGYCVVELNGGYVEWTKARK